MPTSSELNDITHRANSKKRAAAVMDLGDERRAVVRYVHDGTLEGLALALDLAKRKGESDDVLDGIVLYYSDLNKKIGRRGYKVNRG